jgi:two-component system CheB/CheR fusion protein
MTQANAEAEELRAENLRLATRVAELETRQHELTQLAAEVERESKRKDEFLATLSHELRTPLASVLLHTQLLRQSELSPSNLARALDSIERGTLKQVQLIDDLVDASYIVAGNFKLNFQACDLRSLIEAAVQSVRELSSKKAITLDAVLAPNLGQVWADPVRVSRVALNLLSNAIKFTEPGGRILLTLEIERGIVQLQVKDTGCGIDAEFLDRIFDRLDQKDGSIVRRHGGLGLGLAIVRRIVELLGGTITAESPGLGHGATFTVRFPSSRTEQPLPSSRDDAKQRERHQPLDRPGRTRDYSELRGLAILVVDDDSPTRDAIVEVLRLAGADVRAASSAAQAMRELDRFTPLVVVSDIAMPGEDGYSFLRRLRKRDPHGNRMRALALTAFSTEQDRQRAEAAGFHAHLPKPVDIDRLRDAVAALVRH